MGASNLGIHERIQRRIERVFFKGISSNCSHYLTYLVGNVILMLFLFYLLLNNIAYNWTGQLYPAGSGFNLSFLSCYLDNAIPFIPEWVILYIYLFYSMVILTMLYFGFIQYKKGYALGWSLVLVNLVAVLIYILFPVSTYWWREDFLAKPLTGNFWANQVYNVWATDTSFNCFPSLHAAVSTSCVIAWYQHSKANPRVAYRLITVATLTIAIGVILSTLFIKQHYMADEVAGLLLALGICRFVYGHFLKNPAQA